MRLFTALFVLLLAAPALAQEPKLFALCSEGEVLRLCGYDPSLPGRPVAIYPFRGKSTLISINGGRLAAGEPVSEGGFIVATDIFLSDVDGGNASLFVRIPIGITSPREIALAPDLRRLAYVEFDKLFVYDRDTETTTEVVSEDVAFTGRGAGIKWSPDGRRLVFSEAFTAGDGTRSSRLATVLADGSAPPTVLNVPGAEDPTIGDGQPDWSPDGDRIAFFRTIDPPGPGRTSSIHTVSAQGGTLTTVYAESGQFPFIPFGVTGLEWSEDGTTLAYFDRRSSISEVAGGIFTVASSGGTPTRFSTEIPGAAQTWAEELVEWQTPLSVEAELLVSVSADPDTIAVGGEFDVQVVVVNEGDGDAENVRATGALTITSDNGGAATVLSGPEPTSIAKLEAGTRDTLVYRARADALGTLAFEVPIVGTDEAGNEVEATPVCLVGGDNGGRRSNAVGTVGGLRVATTQAHAAGCGAEVRDAVFTWEQADVPAFQITFQGPSESTDGDAITEWDWTFGDGVTGTGRSAVHRYDDPGSVEVTLSTVDLRGNRTETTRTVEVGRFGVIVEDDGTVDLVPRPGGQLSLSANDLPAGLTTLVTVGQSVIGSVVGGGSYGVVSTGNGKVLFEGRPVSRINDEFRGFNSVGLPPLFVPFYTKGGILEGEAGVLVDGVPLAAVDGRAELCCLGKPWEVFFIRPELATLDEMRQHAVPPGTPGWPPTTQLNAVIELLGGTPPVSTVTQSPASAGDTQLDVVSDEGFEVGGPVLIVDPDGGAEVGEVAGFGSIVLAAPLQRSYPVGSRVSAVRPSVPTSSDESPLPLPEAAAVDAYPNPASSAVTLRYAVPTASAVRVTVHDVLGREIVVLVDEERAGGVHEVPLSTAGLASGTYLVRLSAGTEVAVRAVTVVR